MTSVTLALLSFLVFGGSDFCGGLASRRLNVLAVLCLGAPASLVIETLFLWAAGGVWSLPAVLWGAASGVAYTFGFGLLYWCLAKGPMSLLSPISATVSAIIPVTVGIAEGERLGVTSAIGLVGAILAVSLVSSSARSGSARASWPVISGAVGGGLAIAVQLICLHQAPTDSGAVPLVVGRIVSFVMVFSVAGFVQREPVLRTGGPIWIGILSGVLDSAATVAFLLAVRSGPLAVVAVITALYPASTVVLARFGLREKISRFQLVGMVAAALSVVLLSIGNA